MSQAYNIAVSLAHLKKNTEAISLMREQLPPVTRMLGNDNELTLKFQKLYAKTLFAPPDGPWSEEKVRARGLMEAFTRSARRVLGPTHPETRQGEKLLEVMTEILALESRRG